MDLGIWGQKVGSRRLWEGLDSDLWVLEPWG